MNNKPQIVILVEQRLANDEPEAHKLAERIDALYVQVPEWYPVNAKFKFGQTVRKKSGSAWHGVIVGWYSTELTPNGYAVESYYEIGSVQIYPEAALEVWVIDRV